MNNQVREYLISVAREENSTVFYSEPIRDNRLKIDLGSEEGQNQLKQLLEEISTYEHKAGRPMLTALAINKNENDQGAGFYELAERFAKGRKNNLRKNWWGHQEAERVRDFWKNENHFTEFAVIGSSNGNKNKLQILFESLINNPVYDYINDWFDMYVDFTTDTGKLKTALLKNPKLAITNSDLYSDLSEEIQSYKDFMRKLLKERSNGISSRGQSVLSEESFHIIVNDSVFKAIVKELLINPSVESYNNFSQWWYNNPSIANRPLLINRAVAACLPEQLSSTVDNKKFWYVIDVLQSKYEFSFDKDPNWNWFSANQQLTIWLDRQLRISLTRISNDTLKQQIWRNIFVWLIYEKYHGKPEITPNKLIRRGHPQKGYTTMPETNARFVGYDVDFEAKAKIQKDLGDAGEELVKLHEITELENRKMFSEAKRVHIAKPGEGFDVLSFDMDGREKYIEVKTTTGKDVTKFFLTRHELKFMRKNKGQYSLYRVYHYDEENNSGEFFELSGDIEEQLLMDPTQYEVVYKERK